MKDNYFREKHILYRYLGTKLVKLFKDHHVIVAGGTITSLFSSRKINDVDCYFKSKSNRDAVVKELNTMKGAKRTFETEHAIMFEIGKKNPIKVQTVLIDDLILASPTFILAEFDYTICMGAFDFQVDKFIVSREFLAHLAQRRLVFNIKTKYPIVSLLRAVKFINRGYRLAGIEALKIGLTCNALQIKTYKDLREQILGIDTLFLRELTDRLSKPETAENDYDFEYAMDLISELLEKYGRVFEDSDESIPI